MYQDTEFFMDINDPDLTSPFSIVITYFDKDPKGLETTSILSNDVFALYEDAQEAFDDWGVIAIQDTRAESVMQRYGVDDIYVDISLYDSHDCAIATAVFQWQPMKKSY